MLLTATIAAAQTTPGARPQNPVAPYPYRVESVEYSNEAANVKLVGTLTIPDGVGPFPSVLLLTGSGPQDRDQTLLGHRPFLVLADHLTRRGVAVLRMDDRGVGGSTGRIWTSTATDFARDALEGVRFLQGRKEIAAGRIGLIGHSEGASVASMAASLSDGVAYIVLLGAPGMTGEEITLMQMRTLAATTGLNEQAIRHNQEVQRQIFQVLRQETQDDPAEAQIRSLLSRLAERQPSRSELAMMTTTWFRSFLTHDPLAALARVQVPILALWGSNDLQVPPAENLPPLRRTLENAGHERFTLQILEPLNHLFQTSKSGLPNEYGEIQETFARKALDRISGWILAQTGVSPSPR